MENTTQGEFNKVKHSNKTDYIWFKFLLIKYFSNKYSEIVAQNTIC
jgi:hypothetical protein